MTEALITWKDFQACMPWEISLLVGGGFALAEGTKVGSGFNGNPTISVRQEKTEMNIKVQGRINR